MKTSDVLIVIDMQNDFIDGALGTKEAQHIVNAVVKKIEYFGGEVIYTRDTHKDNYLETLEGQKLPVKHCIKDTDGWQLERRIRQLAEGKTIIDKPAFGSLALPHYLKEKDSLDSVVMVGLCTDICVISNALILKSAFPETEIIVDKDCCAGVTPESHEKALEIMETCQIRII
jgi:nicotinamidase-related amidase